ncbi:MAG: DUF4097 family beta strand repeat protein [Acidobacteria bacterium]|nr:DUF4097 family beta strand repeat protein [Acidobacteriota bacterium]
MKRILLGTTLAFAALIFATSAAAQDFQKSYSINAGGQIKISNVSGDIFITGYDGNAILVTANKEGRDRDKVEVEDLSSSNRVEVQVKYPRHCNCDASINFKVQVPRSINFDFEGIHSVSGEVEIQGVRGNIKVASVSGEVHVKDVSGAVNASSVSGSVEVEIQQLVGKDDLKFSSVSGSVQVKMPGDLDAEVDMSTLSGSLKTDFPLEIRKEKYGPRNSVKGRLGDGSRRLHMSSVSGSLTLSRI